MPQLIVALVVIAIIIYVIGFIFAFVASIVIFVFHAVVYILQLMWLGVPGGVYGLLLGAAVYYLFKRSFAKDAINSDDNQVLKKDSFNFGTHERLIAANYDKKRKDVDSWVVSKLASSSKTEIARLIDSKVGLDGDSSRKKPKEIKPPKVKMGIDSLLWFSIISICTLLVVPAYLYKNPEFITASASSLKQLTDKKTSRKIETKKWTSTTSSTRLVDGQGMIISSVNIRISPNKQAKKIGVLSSGVRVRVLGFNETKKWVRVRVLTSNLKGRIGYVFGKYVKRNSR